MTLPNRTLTVIVDELHTALNSETANILTIGALLTEAKAHVKHGEWLPWLKNEFSMSERTAQRYMKAHEFAKSATVADLNLSPSALYLLAEDGYWGDEDCRIEATDAVMKAAAEGRVGYDRAKEIIDLTCSRSAPALNTTTESETSTVTDAAEGLGSRGRGINPRDDALFCFSTVLVELVRLISKQKVERFAATSVSADDLAMAGKLLTDLADLKKARGAERALVGNGTESPEESAERMKREHAADEAADKRAA